MGGSAGFIFEMIARLKANKELLRGNRFFDKAKENQHAAAVEKLPTYDIHATEADWEKIRKEQQLEIIKYVFASLITIFIIAVLINWLLAERF